jgi:hypothetical protein
LIELTAPSESSNLSKRKKSKSKTRNTYRLVVTEDGKQRQLSNKEFERFAKKWPHIASIILDTSKVPEDYDEERDTWDDVAL